LREPLERLVAVDFRVCNGAAPEAGEISMTLDGDVAVALDDPARERRLDTFAGRPVHAVAGIGNPGRFFAQLRGHGLAVVEHPFPDHKNYLRGDLEFGDDLAVLMTAKDAIKCRGFARVGCWFVPVRARLATAFFDAVAERCKNAVARE